MNKKTKEPELTINSKETIVVHPLGLYRAKVKALGNYGIIRIPKKHIGEEAVAIICYYVREDSKRWKRTLEAYED